MNTPGSGQLGDVFGSIDIYVFDQIQRGRIAPDMRILDAGCGTGRNLAYLMRQGVDVSAVDANPDHIATVRELAASLAPELPADQFRVENLTNLSFDAETFDVVICSAVLHFLEDEAEFRGALDEMFRVLRPGGLFFARLSSTVGVEELLRPVEGRRYRLPDGQTWFLVDEDMLAREAARLGATAVDPLKTTVVHGQRSMTTWVLRKE